MIYVVEKCQKSCWLSKIVKATNVKNISQFGRYEGFSLEVDVQYSENLHELHNDLPFLPERMKIEQIEKLVTNLHDKTEHVIHIRNLKQALNHGLILKKVHRVIQFNKKAWLSPYIDINTKLRQKANYNFEEDFFKMNNGEKRCHL